VLYFATPSTPAVRAAMAAGLLGAVDTPGQMNILGPTVTWLADNGCGPGRDGTIARGYPGDAAWLAWLQAHRHPHLCRFATAPDVVGDAVATLARSAPFLPVIRALGYPAALVAQDGLEALEVPWESFDVLFLGGTTSWKLSRHAQALTAEALGRGVPVHMGRVNSLRRLRHAQRTGCTTADGTIIAHAPDRRLPEVLGWMNAMGQQMLDWTDERTS